jgi:hypothetical protein
MRPVNTFMVFLLAALTFSESFASVPLGASRKSATGTIDMYGCLQGNEYYIVNFAAYPADAVNGKKLLVPECINLPETGNTRITLDLLDRDVRHKEVAVKVLKEDGQLISETPYSIAKQGNTSIGVNFKAPGKYQVVLYVKDTDFNMDKELTALHIPVAVAMPGNEPAAKNTMTGFFVLLGVIIISLAFFVPRLLRPAKATV